MRERAVARVARQARRQYLAGCLREPGPAEQLDHGVPVDGQVHRATDADVVERALVRVHGQRPDRHRRARVHLVRIGGAQLAQAVQRRHLEHPVGLAVLHLRHLGLVFEAEAVFDHVGDAFGLRLRVPGVERGIALQSHPVRRVVAGDAVRAGAGERRRARILRRRGGGQHAGMGQRQLEQEVRVRPQQPQGQRPGGVVRRGARQRAVGRRRQALGAAGEAGIEAARRRPDDAEDAPERGGRVARADRRAVREAQPGAKVEAVDQAAFLGLRHRIGQVRHELQPSRAADPAEPDQAVIHDGEQLPVLPGVVDLRVDAAGAGAGQQPQRPLRVRRLGRQQAEQGGMEQGSHRIGHSPARRRQKALDTRLHRDMFCIATYRNTVGRSS